MSDESGREEVYLRAFPEPGRKLRLSTRGGVELVWSSDGRREHSYRDGDGRLIAAPTTAEPHFMPGRPETLFAADHAPGIG